MAKGKLKCQHCDECLGLGCIGQLPGLGGVFNNQNFQLNCEGWKELYRKGASSCRSASSALRASCTDRASSALRASSCAPLSEKIDNIVIRPENLRCGPVTGAVENIGYEKEEDFYYPYLKAAADAGIGLCVGDGCPDLKLQLGIAAMKRLNEEIGSVNGVGASVDVGTSVDVATRAPLDTSVQAATPIDITTRAAFFLKPYPDQRLYERLEWVKPYAEYIGIDIDSYNILTMRNLVSLERKSALQLENFRKRFDVPFVIKGVFTDEDIALVKEVHPDVVYISNHGGRVETRIGSTADFLEKHAAELKKHCQEIWVDGGIRSRQDVQTALFYGADKVIFARPLIHAVFDNTADTLANFWKKFY